MTLETLIRRLKEYAEMGHSSDQVWTIDEHGLEDYAEVFLLEGRIFVGVIGSIPPEEDDETTYEITERFSSGLLRSSAYQASIRKRAIDGTLPDVIEELIWHHGNKPPLPNNE